MRQTGTGKANGLREVAAEAGVSAATVSNTINRPELVAPETRLRVTTAIERLQFVPHLGAASLKKGQNRLIGLVVPDITNPFYNSIAQGVLESADTQRHAVVLCNSQDEPEREELQLQMLAEQRAVGALVVPLSANQTRLNRLRQLGSHLVVVDRAVPEDQGCSVSIDDVHGGQIAMTHLTRRCGVDVALVNGRASIRQCGDRSAGAQRAWRAAGGTGRLAEFVVDEMTTIAGEEVGATLARTRAPRGIFCTNDQLAIGVIRGLAAGGVEVPATTVVVGYGDLAIAAEAQVPLTTVAQPTHTLGRVAVELLLAEMGLLTSHRHTATVFQPTMVIRRSAPDGAHPT